MLARGLRSVALAGLLCAVASGASPERSVTATRPALKKQVALESGLPATRQALKGYHGAVVKTQHRAETRSAVHKRAALEGGMPATRLTTKHEDTKMAVMNLGGGGLFRAEPEAREAATVKNKKARLPCTLSMLRSFTYSHPRALEKRTHCCTRSAECAH